MIADGADLLDIGGESSRPGAAAVSLDEELRRVIPVVEALALAKQMNPAIPLSVDTTKAEVARAAIDAGASIINDITALRGDPAMLDVIASSEAGVVLMHMQGTPATMQIEPHYDDVLAEIHDFLAARIDAAVKGGIALQQIAVDPGIGFGKTLEHNLKILHGLRRFETLGCAILIGTSRKGFLGTVTGRPVDSRVTASVASALAACVDGRAGGARSRRRGDRRCDQGLERPAGLGRLIRHEHHA